MNKILLTISPLFWPKMPPLGIAYLESYLTDKGISVDVLDLNNIYYNLVDNDLKKSWLISANKVLEENIISIIRKNFPAEFEADINKLLQYNIVGFSCFKSNMKSTLEIIEILKNQKKDIKIILGGPEISRLFWKTNEKFNDEIMNLADHVIVGEGEKSLHNFLKADCALKKVSEFDELANLENLFYPKFQGMDLQKYPRQNAIPLLFTRGCVRKCNFCSERLLYKSFRTRSIENIIEEIKYHLSGGKIKYFVFFDSMLNGDIRKFEELCDAIIVNFGSINWEAQIAIRNNMDEKVFKKMKKSGCYNLFIGLESGSDNTLKRMNKGFTTKDAQDFFIKLNNAGLFFGISIIIGYPGETEEEFNESLNFVINNKNVIPKVEQINPFTYYDGTNCDEHGDYRLNNDSLRKMEIFINEIKKNNFKYTNAFIGNLIEKI